MSSGGRGRISAGSRPNPANRGESPAEPSENLRKIRPKSGPGGLRGGQDRPREPSGTRPSEENGKKSKKPTCPRRPDFLQGRFWGHLGVRPGPRNRPKSSPGPKKRVRRGRRRRFSSIFLAVAVRSRSRDRFWEGPTLENYAPTTAGARFSQNHRFRKNTEKGGSGDPFRHQKRPEIDVGGPENRQNWPKKMFLDRPFFYRFLKHRKKRKKVEKGPLPVIQVGPAMHGGNGSAVRRRPAGR